MSIVRVGKVTNVLKGGKATVFYEDLGQTSQPLPLLTFGGEYKLPKIGDTVLCLHMENGGSKGFILGTFWSDVNTPKGSGSAYYKDLGGGAYEKLSGSELRLYSNELSLRCAGGGVTVSELVKLLDRVSALEQKVGG